MQAKRRSQQLREKAFQPPAEVVQEAGRKRRREEEEREGREGENLRDKVKEVKRKVNAAMKRRKKK